MATPPSLTPSLLVRKRWPVVLFSNTLSPVLWVRGGRRRRGEGWCGGGELLGVSEWWGRGGRVINYWGSVGAKKKKKIYRKEGGEYVTPRAPQQVSVNAQL